MNNQPIMIGTHFLFFSGQFKKGKAHPDPDARIGYCAAKKRAFVGYRATIINANHKMPIIDYYITPANRHDSKALVPLLLSMEKHDTLPKVGDFYGDNAYDSEKNRIWLEYFEKPCKFHTKDETGKIPKDKRSAKRKSRIRSKVETLFGILSRNFSFGKTFVRGLNSIRTETSLIFSSWNHFYFISYLMERFEDCISLRRLFYED